MLYIFCFIKINIEIGIDKKGIGLVGYEGFVTYMGNLLL